MHFGRFPTDFVALKIFRMTSHKLKQTRWIISLIDSVANFVHQVVESILLQPSPYDHIRELDQSSCTFALCSRFTEGTPPKYILKNCASRTEYSHASISATDCSASKGLGFPSDLNRVQKVHLEFCRFSRRVSIFINSTHSTTQN